MLLSLAGFAGAAFCFLFIREHWFFIGIAVVVTFLYSAPKISFYTFQWLKKIAIGKPIFLAMAWTYVTAALPVLIVGNTMTEKAIHFCIGQFFYIYAICILFDFRDKEDDKAEGIRSMITYFNEKGINILFSVSIAVFFNTSYITNKTGSNMDPRSIVSHTCIVTDSNV